jgi:hypothetical protein
MEWTSNRSAGNEPGSSASVATPPARSLAGGDNYFTVKMDINGR